MANNIRTLGVTEWHGLAQRGIDVPVRIPINGVSMMPLIRRDRDMVTIVPMRRQPLRGDIVMFRDAKADRNVLHRAWRVEGGKILTWGDNCPGPDGWLPVEAVWGQAMLIERGRFRLKCDSATARREGLALAHMRHAWLRFRRRAAGVLPRPVKAILKRLFMR